MKAQQKICKKCILHDGFLGVDLNSEGMCNFCADPEHKNVNWSRVTISEEMRQTCLSDWNSVIQDLQSTKGSRNYDCIVGYSGGKDSTALLYILINDYGLNPLAVTIDTGYVPETAFENMRDTLERINVDQIIIDSAGKTFTKLYKWLFFNHNSNDVCLTKNVCYVCADFVHSIVVKAALDHGIDLILFGYSPDQIANYFYEIPRRDIVYELMHDFMRSDPFTEQDHEWFLTPNEIEIEQLPRILLPYHVIDYQEEQIINLIESKGLVKKGNSSTLKTSCHVVATSLFYDINRYGGIPYIFQYAELARQDPSIRKKWLRTVRMLSPSVKQGKFNELGVNFVLDAFGVSKDELLNDIRKQLEQDPNKEEILKSLSLI